MIFNMIEFVNGIIWGIPGVAAILGVGAYLTFRCGVPQVRLFGAAAKEFSRRMKDRDSGFRALCAALAATVGTGNIAGVAGAIAIGGPGAVFWMWVGGFFGMATKFAESVLAVRYAQRSAGGEAMGGPMYIIRNAMGERWHFLGYLYSFFGIAAAFGVGNATQVNAVIGAISQAGTEYGRELGPAAAIAVGVILAVVVILMVSGGSGRIVRAAELLIPFVSAVYILLCLTALTLRWEDLTSAVFGILRGAFTPKAVTGGMVGSFCTALRTGIARGVFTNEAGMGTAAIAHASAEVDHPVRQGLMGIMEVFLDTMVICTLTALVILTSGIDIPYGSVAGSELTARALSVSFGPWAGILLSGCLCLFALATILGWGMYAGRCVEFLFGRMNWRIFALCQGAAVILGAVLETGFVWSLAELMNGLMAVPNLIMLLHLTPELKRLTCAFRMCYNVEAKFQNDEVNHERKRDRRDPAAYPSGSQ